MKERCIWVSDQVAASGGTVEVPVGNRTLSVKIPPDAKGRRLRLRKGGELPLLRRLLQYDRPDTLLRIRTYDGNVNVLPVSVLDTDTEVLTCQAKISRHVDWLETSRRVHYEWVSDRFELHKAELSFDSVAQAYNRGGNKHVLTRIHEHLGSCGDVELGAPQELSGDDVGRCEIERTEWQDSLTGLSRDETRRYRIVYDERFESNLPMVAAILSHELCHVVYDIYYDRAATYFRTSSPSAPSPDEIQEMEERVDTLVCMTGLSRFQIAASRETGRAIGYYPQQAFEWMHARLRGA